MVPPPKSSIQVYQQIDFDVLSDEELAQLLAIQKKLTLTLTAPQAKR